MIELVQISWFYGIKVSMFYADHLPPHFHASFGEYEAIIDIQKAKIIKGRLPNKQASLIIAWTYLHQDELLENWHRSIRNQELLRIDPLR